MVTVIAFIIPGLDHEPAHWPPFSEGPWKATSLVDFWTHKWHQTFRHSFIEVAGRPMRRFFGPVGGVMGVFILSGMLHDWCIWGMGKGTEFKELGGFFVLSGAGVILEKTWERATGVKVKGLAGWLWNVSPTQYQCRVGVDRTARSIHGEVNSPDSRVSVSVAR